jgi:hypothetical protein
VILVDRHPSIAVADLQLGTPVGHRVAAPAGIEIPVDALEHNKSIPHPVPTPRCRRHSTLGLVWRGRSSHGYRRGCDVVACSVLFHRQRKVLVLLFIVRFVPRLTHRCGGNPTLGFLWRRARPRWSMPGRDFAVARAALSRGGRVFFGLQLVFVRHGGTLARVDDA